MRERGGMVPLVVGGGEGIKGWESTAPRLMRIEGENLGLMMVRDKSRRNGWERLPLIDSSCYEQATH